MKERPILFSGPMVRAILAGAKTQTRRVLKPPPPPGTTGWIYSPERDEKWWPTSATDYTGAGVRCSYGVPGDRLWVRETFANNHGMIFYRADGPDRADDGAWSPSIHMPRSASRITLEVTGVRVERLVNITNEDARAEGVAGMDWGPEGPLAAADNYVAPFARLWNSINERRGFGWAADPWVWVVSFKRVGA